MNSSQEHHQSNDEIDLVELFAKLWSEKLFIMLISLLCGCMALAYLLMTPGKYSGEITLPAPNGTQLAAYAPLNDGITEHYGEFLRNTNGTDAAASQFEVSADGLMADMVYELRDLKEFLAAVKEHSDDHGNMSDEEFFEAKTELISNFTVGLAEDDGPGVKIKFNWRDKNQLLDIVNTTLLSAQNNLNSAQFDQMNELADNIKRRIDDQRKEIASDLASVIEAIDIETESRLLFLREQASLARELGLAENSLTKTAQQNFFSYGTSDEGVTAPNRSETAYLRGYKSLEREIDIIESREGEEKYLLDQNFLQARRSEIKLKNNKAAQMFSAVIETSPFAKGAKIFDIRMESVRVTNTRNAKLILALSLILGLFGSSAFVLIRSALRRQNFG